MATGKPPAGGGVRQQARIVRTAAGARRYGVQIGQRYTEGRVPERGEKGPRILLAKRQLQALGLLPKQAVEDSPHFGKYLQQGVRLFQQRNGLPVTGQLDAGTQRALNRRAASGKPGAKPGGKPRSSRPAGGGSDRPAGDPPGGKARPHKVTTVAGDTLQAIARRELGDPERWREIAKASGLPWANPRALPVGTQLTIPGATPAGSGGGARPRRTPPAGRGQAVPPLPQSAVVDWMRRLDPATRQRLVNRAQQILAAQRGR